MYQFIYSATEDIFPDFNFEKYEKVALNIPVQILCECKFWNKLYKYLEAQCWVAW